MKNKKQIQLNKNVSVPPETYTTLNNYASKLNVPLSYVLRAAIPVALNQKSKEIKSVIKKTLEDTKIKKIMAAKEKSMASYDAQIKAVTSKF